MVIAAKQKSTFGKIPRPLMQYKALIFGLYKLSVGGVLTALPHHVFDNGV